jgi:tetratricopeptide (TPR) repeat protein
MTRPLRCIITASALVVIAVSFALVYLELAYRDGEISSPPRLEHSGEQPGPGIPTSPLPEKEAPAIPAAPPPGRKDLTPFEEFEKASQFLKAGNYEDAIKSFSRVADQIPDALAGLGFAYYSLEQYDRAKEYLEKYLENHDNFISHKLLSRIYYLENDLQKAVSHADKAVEMQEDRELKDFSSRVHRDLSAQQNHIRDVSSHFDIYYDGYGQREMGRKVISLLEDAYAEIGRVFGYFPPESIPVILYADRQFHRVTGSPLWTGGLFDDKIRIPLKGADDDVGALKKVIYHEYTHALVRSITRSCPLWLNEGLAEYFENGPSGDMGEVIPLENLTVPFQQLNPDAAMTAYRVSHAAVTRLVNQYGMYRLKDLMERLSQGEQFAGAFYSAYPVSFDEFRRLWALDSR